MFSFLECIFLLFAVHAVVVYLLGRYLDVEHRPYTANEPYQKDSVNPFIPLGNTEAKHQKYERIKRFISVILLVPLIRILLFVLSLVLLSFCYSLILVVTKIKYDHANHALPIQGWRKIVRDALCCACLRAVAFSFGVYHIDIKGMPDPNAPILVVNHQSNVDPFLIGSQELVMAVSKYEVSKMPLFGSLMKLSQAILVKRTDKNSKTKGLQAIERRARQGTWPRLLIFPEGTRTNGSALISFKRGAFTAGVPVQPVLIRYPYRHCNMAGCGKTTSTVKMLFSSLCQVYNRAELEYLPTYYPSEEEKLNSKLYATNVRNLMASKLNIPMTPHAYEDTLLVAQAMKQNVKLNVTLREIKNRFKTNFNELQQILQSYSEVNTSGDGLIRISDFARALNLDAKTKYVQSIFNALDTSNSGELNFKDFVVGVYMAMKDKHESNKDKIKFVFQVYDIGRHGVISQDEVIALFSSFQGKSTSTPDIIPITDSEDIATFVRDMFDGKEEMCLEDICLAASKNPQILDVLPKTLSWMVIPKEQRRASILATRRKLSNHK